MKATITEENIMLEILEIESGRFGELIGNESLDWEDTDGGYTNKKADRGGATNWGVTAKTLKDLGIKTPVKQLTLLEAYNIYRDVYYVKSGADRVIAFHPHLAKAMCNFAIHAGYNRAVKYLQGILNLQNNQGHIYKDISEDGAFGMRTLAALKAFLKRRNRRGYSILMTEYLISIGAFYQLLEKKDEEQETFAFGWSRRVHDLFKAFFQDTACG